MTNVLPLRVTPFEESFLTDDRPGYAAEKTALEAAIQTLADELPDGDERRRRRDGSFPLRLFKRAEPVRRAA